MKISVIIPILNEEAMLRGAIESVHAQQYDSYEIIAIDGQSADSSSRVAEQLGAIVLQSRPMTAIQLNLGARHATGEALLFLHADCRIETGVLGAISECLNDPENVGGGLRLKMDGPRKWLNWYLSISGTWHARRTQVYLGDHGIFCRRSTFLQLGGFSEVTLMYEFEIMKRLRQAGNLVQLDKSCIASARRFEKSGYARTMLMMLALRSCYRLGLPLTSLEKFYCRTVQGES